MDTPICATCRHLRLNQGGAMPLYDHMEWCHRYPEPHAVSPKHGCGEWSSLEGRSASQTQAHEDRQLFMMAQGALARAAHVLKERGAGMVAEATYLAAKQIERALEELS